MTVTDLKSSCDFNWPRSHFNSAYLGYSALKGRNSIRIRSTRQLVIKNEGSDRLDLFKVAKNLLPSFQDHSRLSVWK